jgi:cardiolipin synthase A/B
MKPFELVHSGEDYFSRLCELIDNAQKEIHFQTYIFDDDSTGQKIALSLKQAAIRGVKIYLLLDGYGSASLSKEFINDLISHGIEFRYFSPLFSTNNFYLGRRLHHKIVVADEHIALIGGINIADKYRGNSSSAPWLDYAVLIRNEEVGNYLQDVCQKIFWQKKRFKNGKRLLPFSCGNNETIKILRNDWLKGKNDIGKSYIQLLKNAQEEIIIVGSYFLPGKKFLRNLKRVSKINGVKVKLILSQVSDVPFTKRATQHLYFSLLKNNIEIYEWKNSVLHGKVAYIDGKLSTIGSFNLNHLSSYGSIELNAEINSTTFASTLKADLEKVITQCDKITWETFNSKMSLTSRFLNWLSYRLLRLFLITVIYLPYKRYLKSYIK